MVDIAKQALLLVMTLRAEVKAKRIRLTTGIITKGTIDALNSNGWDQFCAKKNKNHSSPLGSPRYATDCNCERQWVVKESQ